MDGVLADFLGGFYKSHGIKECVYGNPENRGIWETDEILGMDPETFWGPTNEKGWWADLEKLPEADEMVERCFSWVGKENVCILSSPSESPFCVNEKKEWVRKHYPEFEKRMLFGSAKEFCASKRTLLIDDRDKNIDDFREAKGLGILWPQVWNKNYFLVDDKWGYFESMKKEVKTWLFY